MHTTVSLLVLACGAFALAGAQSTKKAPPLPSICVVCRCTTASNGQVSVHCSNTDAVIEMTRDEVWPTHLRSISLNHAQLQELPELPKQKLHTLSLAHNALVDIPDRAFVNFDLQELNLGYNGLAELRERTLQGAKDLRVLKVHHNNLKEFDWSAVSHMTQLSEIHLQDNHLSNLTGAPLELHELKVLNLSGNSLTEFPTDTCSNLVRLEELDLTNNQLATVPECLQSYLGALQYLILDGNKIARVEGSAFTGLATLTTLSISNLPQLKQVDSAALKGVTDLKQFRCAGNKQLGKLDKSLFFMGEDKLQQDWSIQTIDLSNNGFKHIPSDLVPWTMVDFVDLQDNPWDCNCEAQWMLDMLMPILYKKNSSMLVNFRCASPAHLASRRIVHWLDHKGKPFCEDAPHPETQVAVLQSGSSQGMLIALAVIACAALVLLVVGFILQRRYDQKRRELATRMGRCRRPRNGDVRLTNPKFGI
ncbi:insulin-like growth factor-binding protein complex acid labile subunit [Neocloeon triangulifer]|uniref:insulin-like growth factor-binding protein complex acid labile subunit n=1 Tax=Neocloeon triangulifer TaxID=2078957 RepID=UPI00286F9495|nr:insulin-like growth factor-binding protein complex acid labile subunit [Neocloeon triangulifer]